MSAGFRAHVKVASRFVSANLRRVCTADGQVGRAVDAAAEVPPLPVPAVEGQAHPDARRHLERPAVRRRRQRPVASDQLRRPDHRALQVTCSRTRRHS